MLNFKTKFSRFCCVLTLLTLAACGGGESSSDNAKDALACTSIDGSTLTNDCDFDIFAEVLTGSDDESGRDFFVPKGSAIMLSVTGDFTYGVCRSPSRPKQQGEGFVCE